MQVCLFLLLWQRQLATKLVNVPLFCRVHTWVVAGKQPPHQGLFQMPLLPLHPCVPTGLYDCSLWEISHTFQAEITKYQIHKLPQIGSVLWAAECCRFNRGMWGDPREPRSKAREGPLGPHWEENHPINLHMTLREEEMIFYYVKPLRFTFVTTG